MAQTLSEIKALLAARGLKPKHRFGQNFLHDARKMESILAAAALQGGDLVLEVGPGTGALSERLLEAGAKLVAAEIDRDLEPILRERFTRFGSQAVLVMGDALAGKRDLNPAVVEAIRAAGGVVEPQPLPAFKLIANLPYNIASPLIANLAVDYPSMARAIVMIQREVGERLAAGPGGKAYGPLGVLVQAMCEVKRIATLPPGCFWPPPQVDSVVVQLTRRSQPLTDDPRALGELLHRLFAQRRKQIGSILGRSCVLPPGVTHDMRPEQLTVGQLIALSRQSPGGGVANERPIV